MVLHQVSEEGFGDMQEEDVEEVFVEKAVEPTDEDLDRMTEKSNQIQ